MREGRRLRSRLNSALFLHWWLDMKTDMPHKELEQFMRDNIVRDKIYTPHLLYGVYQDILKRDGLIEKYSVMTHTSFVKRIGEWSKPGKWLIKKGRGKNAIYSKRACKSDLTWAQVRETVKRLLWAK